MAEISMNCTGVKLAMLM